MPRLDDMGLQEVLGVVFFQATIKSVYVGQAKADILVNVREGDTETWEDIPLFYHCEPNPAFKFFSGGLDGADVAFEEGDSVIVKVNRNLNGVLSQADARIIGFTNKLEPCGIDLVRAWTSIVALRITFTYIGITTFVVGKTVFGEISGSGIIAHLSTESNTMYVNPYTGTPDSWGDYIISEDEEGVQVEATVGTNAKYALEVGEVLDPSPYV